MPEVQDRVAAAGSGATRRQASARRPEAAVALRVRCGHSRGGPTRRRPTGSVPAVRLEHDVERV